jgi:ribonuclease HI
MNVYTDGACKENYRDNGVAEGKGGWAFIILESQPGKDMEIIKECSGYKEGTTNQEMEIVAVAEAFRSIGEYSGLINLYSDSAYVINCLKDRWFDKWEK